MDVLNRCCRGLDVHKSTVGACLLRSAAVKRLRNVLEDANLKVAGVATDLLGVSGRALVAGTTDPSALAALAKGKLRQQRAQRTAGLRKSGWACEAASGNGRRSRT